MVFKSLRQRLLIMGLVPVGLILLIVGWVGFIYIRQNLLAHWEEASLLKLERAGHYIKMRLNRPVLVLDLLKDADDRDPGGALVQNWILDHLSAIKGISQVEVLWTQAPEEPAIERRPGMGRGRGRGGPMMRNFHHAEIARVGDPDYDPRAKNNRIRLSFSLKDNSGQEVGRVRLFMDLDYILADLRLLGWWESEMACLVDQQGYYLAHTGTMAEVMKGRVKMGGEEEFLEDRLVKAMSRSDSGTVFGPGRPPSLVAGYYRIKETPWTLIMYAPGETILGSIFKFRLYYFVAVIAVIISVLVLIRSITGRVIDSVTEVSHAARDVARGKYHHLRSGNGRDEIGLLINSFNTMVDGLRERDFIRDTFGRYMDPDVARTLLKRPESIKMGGEKREAAILMSDVRGFTNLVESMSPEDAVRMLNNYFSHVIKAIYSHGGIIVDFFGDGVLVFFDPLDKPAFEAVGRAYHCARDVLRAAAEFNAESKGRGEPEFPTAVGLNLGPVVIGNIGSETRTKYGVVGLAVNVAQRIQAHAKGGQIVISDAVFKALDKEAEVERTFEVELKGVAGRATLHLLKS